MEEEENEVSQYAARRLQSCKYTRLSPVRAHEGTHGFSPITLLTVAHRFTKVVNVKSLKKTYEQHMTEKEEKQRMKSYERELKEEEKQKKEVCSLYIIRHAYLTRL